MLDARTWVAEYFNVDNQHLSSPYAYPAYDTYDSGSGPSQLNDGDLLAPALLNAAPTIRAFYSLQRVRPQLVEALGRIPVGLRLPNSVEAGTMPALLGDLAAVLDGPERPAGVRLTTLFKVLHRKRPELVPLYDQFVGACYVGRGDQFPVQRVVGRSWRAYTVTVAAAMSHDLSSQPAAFAQLGALAPRVSPLRLLDVVAWKLGRRAPKDDIASIPDVPDDDSMPYAAPGQREHPVRPIEPPNRAEAGAARALGAVGR